MTVTTPARASLAHWIGSIEALEVGELSFACTLRDHTGTDTLFGAPPTYTILGYNREDVRMDGSVEYVGSGNDRDPILVNVGGDDDE